MLSRDQLLAKVKNLRREAVHVVEWDETVYVRGMTAHERTVFSKKVREDDPNRTAWALCQCIVDESGVRAFNDKDVKTLGEASVRACEQILAVVTRLSAFDAEALENAVKNSEPTPSDA